MSHPFGRRRRGLKRSGLLVVRITVMALLLGTGTDGMLRASAQADPDAGTYESPRYGFHVEWDTDVWSFHHEGSAPLDYQYDYLNLIDAAEGLLFIQGSDTDWADPDACLSFLLDGQGIDPDTDRPMLDSATGEPYEIREEGHSAAAFASTSALLVDCRQDPDSDLIVGFAYSSLTQDFFGQAYPLAVAVMDTLDFGENGATSAASAVGSAGASSGSRPSSGIDWQNGTYTAPTYGYTLAWDQSEWGAAVEESAWFGEGYDVFHLWGVSLAHELVVAGASDQADAAGVPSAWPNLDACLTDLLANGGVFPTGDSSSVTDPRTGEPYMVHEDGRAAAAFEESNGDIVLADCRDDPDGDVIVGFQYIYRAFFAEDVADVFGDLYPRVEPILESLSFAGSDPTSPGLSAEGTPDPGDMASPEPSGMSGQVNPDPDLIRRLVAGADEDAGTYISPTLRYGLEWDADDWTVESDVATGDEYPRDLLVLRDVDNTTLLFVESSEAWSDPDECVTALLRLEDLDLDDGEPVEDVDGDTFEVDAPDRMVVAAIFEIDVEDGDTQEQVRLFECRQDPESGLVVGFTARSGIVADFVEVGYPLVEVIADSLTFETDRNAEGAGMSDASASAD